MCPMRGLDPQPRHERGPDHHTSSLEVPPTSLGVLPWHGGTQTATKTASVSPPYSLAPAPPSAGLKTAAIQERSAHAGATLWGAEATQNAFPSLQKPAEGGLTQPSSVCSLTQAAQVPPPQRNANLRPRRALTHRDGLFEDNGWAGREQTEERCLHFSC